MIISPRTPPLIDLGKKKNSTFLIIERVGMIKTAGMTDVPTLTNDSWKLGYGGSKKYEYI